MSLLLPVRAPADPACSCASTSGQALLSLLRGDTAHAGRLPPPFRFGKEARLKTAAQLIEGAQSGQRGHTRRGYANGTPLAPQAVEARPQHPPTPPTPFLVTGTCRVTDAHRRMDGGRVDGARDKLARPNRAILPCGRALHERAICGGRVESGLRESRFVNPPGRRPQDASGCGMPQRKASRDARSQQITDPMPCARNSRTSAAARHAPCLAAPRLRSVTMTMD